MKGGPLGHSREVIRQEAMSGSSPSDGNAVEGKATHERGISVNRAVERLTINPARGLVWAALSFATFVGALFATLPILAVVNRFSDLPHLTEMAAWSVVWGGLSLIGVLVAARLAFGAWLPVHPPGVIIAAVGVALSAVVHVVLQQREIARF